jgi:hypothetical protein
MKKILLFSILLIWVAASFAQISLTFSKNSLVAGDSSWQFRA